MKSGFKAKKNGGERLNSNMSDSEKVSLLYTLYEQEMYRICFAILNERYAAEDAVSESFLKLIQA